MSLGNGRQYLAIPGPSVMPERVIRAMMRAAPNIYDGEMPDLSLIHISEPTRHICLSRMPSSA